MRFRTIGAALLIVLGGCSKNATAPNPVVPVPPAPTAAPTRFAVYASDRGRSAGAYLDYITGIDVAGTAGFTFGGGIGVIDRHPSITESGVLLVYQSAPGRGGSSDVFAYNRVSSVLTDDSNVNSTAEETDPFICLDGTRLAFVRDTLTGRRIRLYDTQATRLIPLPGLEGPAGTNDWAPSLSEHGQRMVFVSDRNGTPDVFVYQISTGTLTAPADLASPGNDVEPSLSGAGRYVCFASDRSGGSGGYDLYVYDLTAGALVPLSGNSSADDRDPSISIDGSMIEFVSDRTGGAGGMDVWLLTRATGAVTAVPGQNSSGNDVDPVLVWR